MKIAIIGVGAMGSVYAALLAEAGHEVWAVDPWQAHVEAINSKGLRVEGASGDRIIKGITATVDVTAVGPCDLCIIATKAGHVGAAICRRDKGVVHLGGNRIFLPKGFLRGFVSALGV